MYLPLDEHEKAKAAMNEIEDTIQWLRSAFNYNAVDREDDSFEAILEYLADIQEGTAELLKIIAPYTK